MTPQENYRSPGYKTRQRKTKIKGEEVYADPELIPLINALNDVGLVTRSHCSGHGSGNAFIVIKKESITDIQIRDNDTYNEIVINWKSNFKQ